MGNFKLTSDWPLQLQQPSLYGYETDTYKLCVEVVTKQID